MKDRIKSIEADRTKALDAAEAESRKHIASKEKFEREERNHVKTKDALQAAKDDVASMKLQMDAMKVEMEAQRKAFVVNVNWAARCTELKAKFDAQQQEYDRLLQEHVQAKAAMETAVNSESEFAQKAQAAQDAYTAALNQLKKNQEDIKKNSELGDDIANKLKELQDFREKAQMEAVAKKQGSQQALSVLQRSLAAGDKGLITSAFSGWASLTKTEKIQRLKKDKAMKSTLKNIASEGQALVGTVFKEWARDMEAAKRAALQAASKRLEESNAGAGSMASRQKAIAQLEKQFAGEDKVLIQSTFSAWCLGQLERKKKDQGHQKAARMIYNAERGVVESVWNVWNVLAEKTRKTKADKAASSQKAARMIANSGKALAAEIFTTWWAWIEDIRKERKQKEAGTAKAMRMMANSAMALVNLCFDSWAKFLKEAKKKGEGNKKALRMINNSSAVLVKEVFVNWKGSKASAKAKEQNTAKAVRMIASSNGALVASVFQGWSADVRKNKDKNKKIRALEKSFGAQDMGLKMVVFGAWQGWAKVEARKKKVKENSMKSAIKSITGNQDLVICHFFLFWARFIKGDIHAKLSEEVKAKEAALGTAVADAKAAIDYDLQQALEEVNATKEEIARLTQERDDAKASLEGIEARLAETAGSIKERERQLTELTSELEESRAKARRIGDELAKVGIFLQSVTPRKASRGTGGSDSRPRSGSKGDTTLPRINGNSSRPMSGSKTARGVAGERSGSARRRSNELFDRIDANQDGTVTREELAQALESGEVLAGDVEDGGY